MNDGTGDQTAKLQNAIDDDGAGGTRKGKGVARYPAQVYLPGGIYQIGKTIDLTVGTIIVGDPLNPPVIKAAKGFDGDYLIMGYDSDAGQPETSFAIVLKNIILDTTALNPDRKITALQWGVAQGSGLTNLQIRMPTTSVGHIGIDIKAGSTIAVTDVVSLQKKKVTLERKKCLTNDRRISPVVQLESRTPTNRLTSRISLSSLVAPDFLPLAVGRCSSNKQHSPAVAQALI